MAITEKYVSALAPGGGSGTIGSPFTYAEALTDSATTADGTRYNFKADGTYARTTNSDSWGGGTVTSPLIFRGYMTTPGDGYQGRTFGNGPLITTNMPSVTFTTGRWIAGSNTIMESLDITSAGAAGTVTGTAGEIVIAWCRFINTGTATTLNIGTAMEVIESDIFQNGSGSATAIASTSNLLMARCRVRSIPGHGLTKTLTTGTTVLINNLFYNCGNDGINSAAAALRMVILGNTIVGCTGDGIDVPTGASSIIIDGNMITDNGAYGINLNGATGGVYLGRYNRFRDNTSGNFNGGSDWLTAYTFGDVTTDTGGQSTDYTDAPSLDFSLIAQSPATSAAWPYLSMGAYQRSQTNNVSFGPLTGTIVDNT